MRPDRDVTRTVPFWLIFAASAMGGMTNAASTPIIPVYVERVLDGGTTLSGLVISLAAVASMVAMPVAGMLGDRRGYRAVALTGGVLAALGMAVLAVEPSLWGAGLGRVLFGLGNAAAMTLVMTWLVAMTPAVQRGKALSIFGLSVWIGLALGPQIGAAVNQAIGPVAVFVVCAALELATATLIACLPRPPRPPRPPRSAPADPASPSPRRAVAVWRTFLAVWVPGVVAAAAWCGEGLMLGFLIVHFEAWGVPASGLTGAASVFAVFSVSVIVARIALASLPDRIGPLRSTAISLCALAAGLAALGFARSFWVAAVGAAIIGIGFSPLYPSLTMLATRGLTVRNRALGLGLFSSFTSVGYAGGALIGGLVIAVASTTWAFVLVAGLQLGALAAVTIFTRDDTPRERPHTDVRRDPAA
jgi:MFS family permease